MLVYYHKGFTLKGYGDFIERKGFKKIVYRHPMYLSTGVNGICDEADVEAEVAKKVEAEMSRTDHWADANFSGWTEICTDEAELRKAYPWSDNDFITKMHANETHIEYINKWPMKKILENLNGVQFAQFCKENDIPREIL